MSGAVAAPLTRTTLPARGVLFDMDGTLLDSTRVVEAVWRRFAERHRRDPAVVLAAVHGCRAVELVDRFARPGTDVRAETDRIRDEECADLDRVTALPGALELVRLLPPSRWAVVTSAGTELARARLHATGFGAPAVLVTADDVTAGKPDPEGYRTAAARLGIDPGAAVVFEDAEVGLRAARAAGATTVVVGDRAAGAADEPRIDDFRGAGVRTTEGELCALTLLCRTGPGTPGSGPPTG